MPKFFVVSDIHSYYTPLKKALDEKGFDPNDNNHWLIVCGDAFDRGHESTKVLNFLMNLERKVLIRGNHEDLLEECCKRGFPYSNDKSNGTTRTIQDISNILSAYDFSNACDSTYNKTSRYRELLVNYFETKNFIFVHGWIPCEKFTDEPSQPWWQIGKTFEYNPDWRNCNEAEWESARWINGIQRGYIDKIIEPSKTIVCGHWHCSHGHRLAGHCGDEFKEAMWEPFWAEGIIAIDRCTAFTCEVNVLVLEDEFLE